MKLTEVIGKLLIEEDKLRKYLLSPTHPDGGSKADFLMRFGFDNENWTILHQALMEHAEVNEITDVEQAPFGVRYTVSGPLVSPDDRHPHIEAIWQIQPDDDFAHLITLMPMKGEWK